MGVDEGLRFGDRARDVDTPGEFVVEPLPEELLDEVRGIDREATYHHLRETTLAFGTDQGGTRVAGPVVLASRAERSRVIERLLDVLDERYDAVERDGDVVVARERVFDPEKAKTLGVPEGPAFGKLSAGEAVQVDGERIPPEVVQDTRERRFALED
jgi:D-aminoacyl-tRNA deacylase